MDERIKKAYTIIKKNYLDEIVLDTLAERVGLSKFHLHRLFKAEFNETPAECLKRTRLELARHHIKLKTQMSMSQLATECGFSSLSVFSRAFSNRYGITPTEMHRQEEAKFNNYNNNVKVDILYLPELILCYEATQLLSRTLGSSFDKSLEKLDKLGLQSTQRRFGVLNHLSVHNSSYAFNYFAGIEISGKVPTNRMEDMLVIQKGKYASFILTSKREAFIQELINFKYHWLDHSGYVIHELFALEEILDDGFVHRRIYIPIKRG